jgi:hypothetical protein
MHDIGVITVPGLAQARQTFAIEAPLAACTGLIEPVAVN